MPLTTISLKLSNGINETLYYPSSVVKDYFVEDQELQIPDFINLALRSLEESDRRVTAKFGLPCIGCAMLKSILMKWDELYKNETVYIIKIHEFNY